MPPRLSLTTAATSVSRQALSLQTAAASTRLYASIAPAKGDVGGAIPSSVLYEESLLPTSHRRPEFRKSQLLRQYTSLLRTSPLTLFFQHNNLQAKEWIGIRRELAYALNKVDETKLATATALHDTTTTNDNDSNKSPAPHPNFIPLTPLIRLQTVRNGIFEPALRILDYYRPEQVQDGSPAHDLSTAAYQQTNRMRGKHILTPLFLGPVAVLTFPCVSPDHLKAALSILSPQRGVCPAPKRRLRPTYYDPAVQVGLKKLSLLAARVDGKVLDDAQTQWVTTIEGGMDGLRSQLVATLQGASMGLATTLEGATKSLYVTMESRRLDLDEQINGKPNQETADGETPENQ